MSCPHCDQPIDVSAVLHRQIEQSVRTGLEARYRQQDLALKRAQAKLTQERQDYEQQLETTVTREIQQRTAALRNTLRAQIESEQGHVITSMRTELDARSQQVRTLHKIESENEKLKREQAELRDVLTAEFEKRHTQTLAQERQRIQQQAAERAELQLFERDQVISQLNARLKEAQQQAEQGSMQTQGEAQEVAIESWLVTTFPADGIEPVTKGAQGGDCVQVVFAGGQQAGTIYYESKRTKRFADAWLPKFRQDMQARAVDVGVLVTQTMPKDMPRMGVRDGIWICTFEEFKGLSLAIREGLLNVHRASARFENHEDKKSHLYRYLTGNEFRLVMENIVEGFVTMSQELATEKRSIQASWKRREKQLERTLLNTSNLHSAVRGIVGDAVAAIGHFEFDGANPAHCNAE